LSSKLKTFNKSFVSVLINDVIEEVKLVQSGNFQNSIKVYL